MVKKGPIAASASSKLPTKKIQRKKEAAKGKDPSNKKL